MSESDNMDQLRQLIAKRGQVKSRLTRFMSFVKEFSDNDDINSLKIRLKKFENAWEAFDDIQSEIECINDGEGDSNERIKFEKEYSIIVGEANTIIENRNTLINICNNPNPGLDSNNPASSRVQKRIKLPILELPKFSGSYENWLAFRDRFNSCINNDESLSDIDKFQYLQSCLSGEAAETIKSVSLTSANYSTAWKRLESTYEDKKVLVKAHINALFNLPNVTKNSASSIKTVLDIVNTHLACLNSLEVKTENWDLVIIYFILSKCDTDLLRKWESQDSKDLPTLTDMCNFLTKNYKCIQAIELDKSKVKFSKPDNSFKHGTNNSFNKYSVQKSHISSYAPFCGLCKANHLVYQCPELLKLSPEERYNKVRQLKLCVNCFKSSHQSFRCQSNFSCKTCHKRHHTLLHFEKPLNAPNSQNPGPSSIRTETVNEVHTLPSTSAACYSYQINYSQVLLSTAVVSIYDNKDALHECRILLDGGSQTNFITESMVERLKLTTNENHFGSIIGISHCPIAVNRSVNVQIKSRVNEYATKVNCLILKSITGNIPNISFAPDVLDIPRNLKLADPNFYISQPIDMLIGVELFYDLLNIGQIKLGKNLPHLQKTNFGWIVGGTLRQVNNPNPNQNISLLSVESIDKKLSKFWEVEECQTNTNFISCSEIECEEHFKQTQYRTEDGRFVVRLPFKTERTPLGDSKNIALKRLYWLEKKLDKDSTLHEGYSKFIQEFKTLGHIEPVESDSPEPSRTYYLPHHAVIKESSLTTKLRVVFDGSAKTTTGVSLNDNLLVGPTIQDELFSILLRFRSHQVVITADIAKMYRQIVIDPVDRDYQRILWRDNIHQKVQIFRLTRVTYGTSSAPFLAIRCLQQLADDEKTDFPIANQVIKRDFYVDDLLTGADSIEKALTIRDQVNDVLRKGGFELRKWSSNRPNLLPDTSHNSANVIDINKNAETKTLGLIWNCEVDVFKYSLNQEISSARVTKRIILSTISQIFDPLGLIGPILINAKIILQRLWSLKSNWDESVPVDLHTRWLQYVKDLSKIDEIQIPRLIICRDPVTIELHGFSDASENAYGACVYLKSVNSCNEIRVQLVCAKSKVAPLKTISLPRLELCGALLLSRLVSKILDSLSNVSIQNINLWSDSTIVLSWLNTCPSELKTFVANRVAEIQTSIKSATWRHILSEQNPADIISRGASPNELCTSKLWWHGPEFLSRLDVAYLKFTVNKIQEIPERRIVTCLATREQPKILNLMKRYSSFSRLQRIVAYCLRFINNCRKSKNPKLTGSLSRVELRESKITILKEVQQSAFSKEFRDLKATGSVSKSSNIHTLSPFLDKDELIRVGGRLRNAEVSYSVKHPIVLPHKHFVTELLIVQEHVIQLHAGPQLTLSCLRQQYWILSGKSVIRKILHNCVICYRIKPIASKQIMGDLPAFRVLPARPFVRCGVDYAGPLFIKDGFGYRTKRSIKSYIVIFICLSTKAMHLELVCDLTTETFLGAFKRFISRRGNITDIYSDNGTNFVGANKELMCIKKLFDCEHFKSTLMNEIASKNINWHFIPPRAPNFGGLWESGVKSVKYHLKRILGNVCVRYDQLYTILTQIEACLNSRPLFPLSNDPNDLCVLTPGHFLIGDSLTAPLESDLTSVPENRLSKWQHMQKVLQHFWKRWSQEYLHSLQSRAKKHASSEGNLKIGSIVVIKDDNLPPMRWRLGRITEVYPGKDSKVRVVSVKTSAGIIKRSISKICVLPIMDNFVL